MRSLFQFFVLSAISIFLAGCADALLTSSAYRQIDKGDRALQQGDAVGAETFYKKAVNMRGKFSTGKAHLKLGLLYMDHLNNHEAARVNFESFLKLGGWEADKARAKTRLAKLQSADSTELFGICSQCSKSVSGEIQYHSRSYCYDCALRSAEQSGMRLEEENRRRSVAVVVGGGMAVILGSIAGVVMSMFVSLLFMKDRVRIETLWGIVPGYALFLVLSAYLSEVYRNSLPLTEDGYPDPISWNSMIFAWLLGVVVIQLFAIKLSTRTKSGQKLGWGGALGLSLIILPGWLVVAFFSALAGSLGK
jgi:hypothetical protein